MPPTAEPKAIPELDGATATTPERIAARTREGRITLAAWRMNITATAGAGSIVLVETNVGAVFRGDGLFLGWPQETLATAYRSLVPKSDEDTAVNHPQLG